MKEPNTNQITALYCRLSQEDLRTGESLSIENQRLLLKEYADKNGFKNCQYYIYDGYSGVNKNRPDYVRMLKDIESGLVGTVIVKDQSRLGRDHLETGRLMEILFPSYDVRFIAISDGVDSINGLNDMSALRIISTISLHRIRAARSGQYRKPKENEESESELHCLTGT